MPLITYVQPDGVERTINVPVGWTAMEGAVRNGVAGIIAVCNGGCSCATCHVHVDPSWRDRLDPPTDASRLSCLILMTPDQDGLRLTIAGRQI